MRRRRACRAPNRRTRFAAELAQIIEDSMRRAGVANDAARAVARTSIDRVRLVYGGRLVYIARRECADRAALARRIEQLRSEGASMRDIAARLGLSLSYCYEIHAGARHARIRTKG